MITVPSRGNSSTSQPNVVVLISQILRESHSAIPGTQGKLGKDARSVAYYIRERLRTPIQRRHACSGSSLKLPQLVHIYGQFAAMDRDDQPQPDAHLARGDRHHDQREHLPVAVAPHARERDQREVRAIEHQLQAQQHHEGIAPHHDAGGAEREHDRGDRQIPADRHYQPPSSPADAPVLAPTGWPSGAGAAVDASPASLADSSLWVSRARAIANGTPPTPSAMVPVSRGRIRSSGVSTRWTASPSSSMPPRRRASTTAPTAAISSRKEATSNTSRNRVSSSWPM